MNRVLFCLLGAGGLVLPASVFGQAALPSLPEPSAQPLAVPESTDPILRVADQVAPRADFMAAMARLLASSPEVIEALAGERVAEAQRSEARSGLFPIVDLRIAGTRALARNFSNDPDNVIERSRGGGRLDYLASAQQLLFDFGATSRRIEAAAAEIESAQAGIERASEAVALRAIAAWYDAFAYGQMEWLAEAMVTDRKELAQFVDLRITQGVAAEVDRARVESAIASGTLRLAQFARERANADARYLEYFGTAPVRPLLRAPPPDLGMQSRDLILAKARASSTVRQAEARARGADATARAAKSDLFPVVTTGVEASRYGLLERDRLDYDVRAQFTIRQRLFGPGKPRYDQARAKAAAADARAEIIRREALREADIAWSDVEVLGTMLDAHRADYIASRVTRDAVAERFRVSRGTLFDVIDAEDRLFTAAASYIRALSEYDAARYVLLARSGQLMSALQPGNLRD